MQKLFRAFVCLMAIALIHPFDSFASSVSEIKAEYRNGQVFITWKNVNSTNRQYNVYRSTIPIVLSSNLTSNRYLGYVRDSSSKNIRKSQIKKDDYYFVIEEGKSALKGDRGLYVATSASPGAYYYAVTVTNLTNGQEDKTIIAGSNSLLLPVAELVTTPGPVLQTITDQSNGDESYEYVIWGSNKDLDHWPAFNNAGSYGYSFTLQKRGNSTDKPLCVWFQDQDPFRKAEDNFCSNCNILVLDDWVPNGENTYWVGYHEDYNMYEENNDNAVRSSGTIKTYTQVRTHEIIRWAKKQKDVDGERVYMNGNSHNGFGAMLTAMNIPSEVASLYLTSIPIIYKTFSGDKREHQFGKVTSNLPTDVKYPGTSESILIWDFTDMRNWYRINQPDGIPYIQGINGRDDTKAGWVQKYHWYDTLNAYQQGGTWFWDGRTHSGSNPDFSPEETQTDYTRYYTNRSYPAFSNCSINQDPGDGDPDDGDPYGAINGYLDWDDNSISDNECTYSINCFIKTFYVGGDKDPDQFTTCNADVTIRRTKKFKPKKGQTISWANYDSESKELQSGSFTYDGDVLSMPEVKIKKAGSTISLSIDDCFAKEAGKVEESQGNCALFKTYTGYTFQINTAQAQNMVIEIFDMSGRSVMNLRMDVPAGVTGIPIELPSGMYVIRATSEDIRYTAKMLF